ncbi:MAG: Arginine-tRNA ligase [Candidatus Amesbacteria bacterium GW2011_GWC1_46_24]|nr:MAG: Arginine-tRNA ligase [Candidatus Amesbacteria bacterium GW2011_GWC1_46_24]
MWIRDAVSLAQKIADFIKPNGVIAKVEVAGTGFINIWLQKEYLVKELERVITQAQDYGKDVIGQGKTVIIDYSAPNIARQFGVGHLRSTIIGQALYNLYKFLGYKVIGDNHLGDWGDPGLEKEGRKWFKKLEDGDTEARRIWQECVDVSMAEFNRIYEILKVKFDEAYGESFYVDKMAAVIDEAKTMGIAIKSEEAWVIEIEGVDIPLMLVKSDGGTTYATRDLATLKFRGDKWNPEIVIYEVGAEQALYFQQLFVAAQRLGYVRTQARLVHTKHGLYLGMDGKRFRTREGQTVKLEGILIEAIDRARKLGNTDQAQTVGVGAVKYFDLMHNIQSDIVFDWEKIMNLEGNSGPYLQYTFARTQSVLAKSQFSILNSQFGVNGLKLHPEEEKIIRWIYRFGEVVEEAAGRYAPNLLCNYLFELAQGYNSFYNKCSILGAQGPGERDFRLLLTAATGQVLKNGLSLLGIEAPDRM